MLQLVYISTAVPGFDPAAVDHILGQSRRNNARDRLSGLLLFDGRRFMQALEGDASMVEACFARVSRDTRHRAVVKLSERTVAEREFGDWAMAAQRLVGAGGVREAVEKLVERVPHASTRAMFTSFAKVRDAA